MGSDPKTSLLNEWNQLHACPNVFVTDGACMTSTGNQSPSILYMALTARAVDHAVGRKWRGRTCEVSMPPMNRREAVKATTALIGGVLITSNGFLVACARDSSRAPSKVLTLEDQIADRGDRRHAAAHHPVVARRESRRRRRGDQPAAHRLLRAGRAGARRQRIEGVSRTMCRERCGDDFASLCRRRSGSTYFARSTRKRRKPGPRTTSRSFASWPFGPTSRPRSG